MGILKWQVAALTDRGCHRPDNQDNLFISDDRLLFVVADGMGGTRNGALASSIAVSTMEEVWTDQPAEMGANEIDGTSPKDELKTKQQVAKWLQTSVSLVNNRILSRSSDEKIPAMKMGTTIVCGVQSQNGRLHIAHVGDSRAYLIRKGKAEVLTVDHSVVMEMQQAGRLTEDQAWDSIYKNLLTRCLGHEDHVDVDISSVVVKSGDWIVFCSDGLNSVLRDKEIGKIVARSDDAQTACEKLMARTLADDAKDNVTIMAIRYWEETDEKKPSKFDRAFKSLTEGTLV